MMAKPAGVTPANETQRIALEYFERGYWPVRLTGKKSPALRGYNGYNRPDDAQVLADIADLPDGAPLAITVPIGVIGIDVDTYIKEGKVKTGGTELVRLEAELGQLPKGNYSTRRGPQPADGPTRSAIYLFQVPPDALDAETYPMLESTMGDNIEVVQYHERVLACAPTVLDGMAYTWYSADGTPCDHPPAVADLPVLPQEWFEKFHLARTGTRVGAILAEVAAHQPDTSKRERGTGAQPRARLHGVAAYAHMDADELEQWASTTLTGWSDEPNPFMQEKVDKIIAELQNSGCRHDDTKKAIWHLVLLAAGGEATADGSRTPGNPGGSWAIGTVGAELIRIRESERDRDGAGEAERLVVGALAKLRDEIDKGHRHPTGEVFGDRPDTWDIELDESEEEFIMSLNGDLDTDYPEEPQISPQIAADASDVPDLRLVHGIAAEIATEPAAASTPSTGTTAASVMLGGISEPDFWGSRPVLQHVFDYARGRRVSPWAVLGNVMVNAVAAVGPHVQLPPLVGSNASLNLFAAIVGTSGGGKGGSTGAARDAIALPRTEDHGVGSGEGIAKLFGHRQPATKSTPSVLVRTRTSAILSIAEISTLTAISGRNGSTILPELCKAFSGESLGRSNASDERTIIIDAHNYRLCVVAGVQPARSDVLLKDADGGTPQRFLWLPANDPDMPDIRPATPTPLPNPLHPSLNPTGGGLLAAVANPPVRTVNVPQIAVATVDRAQVQRHRGIDKAELNGHALLTRLKVMCALAFLDGRADPDETDWELAGAVMTKSNLTRESCAKTLASTAREENVSRAKAAGVAAVVQADIVEKAAITRVTRSLLKNTHGGDWHPASHVRRALPSRDRPHFDTALQALTATGQIEVEPNPSGKGERLRNTTAA